MRKRWPNNARLLAVVAGISYLWCSGKYVK